MFEHQYSKAIHNKKIILCGPTPPPLGGVSVHIKRVIQQLLQQDNQVVVYDATAYSSRIKRMQKLIFCLITNRPDIVYYHTLYNSWVEWALVAFFKVILRYQLVLVDHDCRDLYKRSELFKILVRRTMFLVHQHVLIGNLTVQSYHDNKIPLHNNFSVESPFLPPDLSEEKTILATYPDNLFVFLQAHKPIISANAFKLILLQEKDLYGIMHSIKLVAQLKDQFPAIGLVIALGQRGNHHYYHELQELIILLDIADHIFFLENQKELWPLLKLSNIFLRPTLSDGFSLSIEEALYLGTPTIASDVCVRPHNTVLFKTGDEHDLYIKTKETLEKNC